jgi:hypothetical protein
MNLEMKRKTIKPSSTPMLLGLLACGLCAAGAFATERRFTYTYEPETLPQGAMEFEQWITLQTQRTSGGAVQQKNFNQWQLREELEYGVTDNYTLGLYLNLAAESYQDVSVSPPADVSGFEFDGLSLENRFLVLNPADHAVGLTLYLEPAFSGSEAEVEERLILGQRHGDWKWALNLIHATEWEDNFGEVEGEFAATIGVARDLDSHWSVGLEFWNQNALPEYQSWEYTAFFLGPVVSYRQEKWWATLTVLPQIYGKNYDGNPDGNTSLVLDEQERVNIRLLLGFTF